MADLHGVSTDSALLKQLLDEGNKLRYGQTEGERVAALNALRTPGIEEVAYPRLKALGRDAKGVPLGGYDHAAAERYTSAHAFGKKWQPPEWALPILHRISSGGRATMHRFGVPGVGEERPELRAAEELGMRRGAGTDLTPAERFIEGLLKYQQMTEK